MTPPEDVTLSGPHGPLGVRVYPAVEPTGTVLVWAHGGGFAAGSIDMPEGDWVSRAFAARGITTVSVDYALAPARPNDGTGDGATYPVASEEVEFALGWARERAAEWGGDPDRVAIGGASAGANLAAGVVVRLAHGGRVPAHVVLAYPTVHAIQPATPAALQERLDAAGLGDQFDAADVRDMYENYLGAAAETADAVAAPGTATPAQLAGFPATTIVVSETDRLRVSAEAFAEALADAGVDVTISVEAGTHHGHLNRPEAGHAGRTIDAFVDRLRVA